MNTTEEKVNFNIDQINDATGFANGEEFSSLQELRTYFTPESQRQIFGDDAETDTEVLDAWSETVASERFHCTF